MKTAAQKMYESWQHSHPSRGSIPPWEKAAPEARAEWEERAAQPVPERSEMQGESIATWQERAQAELGTHWRGYKPDSFMKAEIAELRAALARRATAGNAAPSAICEACGGDGSVQCGGFGDLLGNTAPTEAVEGGASALRAEPAGQHDASACDHDWPEKDGQTDIDGACTKCGRSFQRYIHMDCL